MRINRWHPYDGYNRKIAGLDTTTQNIDTDQLEDGWVYVINNICGLETGTKPTTVALGYVRAGKFYTKTKQTPQNNNDSVEYSGQVVLFPGDKIRAEFKGATGADTAEVIVDGYKFRA